MEVWVDATYPVTSVESPRGAVRGQRAWDPDGRRTKKTRQRRGKTCAGRQRLIASADLATASPRGR